MGYFFGQTIKGPIQRNSLGGGISIRTLRYRYIGCLHDPANVQQTSRWIVHYKI